MRRLFKLSSSTVLVAVSAFLLLPGDAAAAECVRCVSNKCVWAPWISGASDCFDYAPGLGCLPIGVCGETMTNILPGGGVMSKLATQVVAENGSTYLRSCSGALISVRATASVAALRRQELAQIVI